MGRRSCTVRLGARRPSEPDAMALHWRPARLLVGPERAAVGHHGTRRKPPMLASAPVADSDEQTTRRGVLTLTPARGHRAKRTGPALGARRGVTRTRVAEVDTQRSDATMHPSRASWRFGRRPHGLLVERATLAHRMTSESDAAPAHQARKCRRGRTSLCARWNSPNKRS